MSLFRPGSCPRGTAQRLLHTLKDLPGFRHLRIRIPIPPPAGAGSSSPLWRGLGSSRAPVAHPCLSLQAWGEQGKESWLCFRQRICWQQGQGKELGIELEFCLDLGIGPEAGLGPSLDRVSGVAATQNPSALWEPSGPLPTGSRDGEIPRNGWWMGRHSNIPSWNGSSVPWKPCVSWAKLSTATSVPPSWWEFCAWVWG